MFEIEYKLGWRNLIKSELFIVHNKDRIVICNVTDLVIDIRVEEVTDEVCRVRVVGSASGNSKGVLDHILTSLANSKF